MRSGLSYYMRSRVGCAGAVQAQGPGEAVHGGPGHQAPAGQGSTAV